MSNGAPEFRPLQLQEWRDLLFLHWRADPATLAPRLPSPLVPDLRDGAAWIGLVPFAIRNLRLRGCPSLPFGSAFGEINLRTYVRLPSGASGVWFFSLDASSPLAVLGARLFYRLPYWPAWVTLEREGETRFFRSQRIGNRARCEATWSVTAEPPGPALRGSLEEFLIERYTLFAGRTGGLLRARVSHQPYPLAPARLQWLREDLRAAAGLPVGGSPLVHYSAGVDVRVSAPEPVAP